jgi:hypothetical protein
VIALVQIALPFTVLVPVDEGGLETLKLEGETKLEGVGPVEVFVHQPYRSKRSDLATPDGRVLVNPDAFNPAEKPPPEEGVVIGEDRAVIRCDAIAVEIRASEFERRTEKATESARSILALACEAVNGVFERIRVLTRATHLKPLDPESGSVLFRLTFMDDDHNRLPKAEGQVGGLGSSTFRLENLVVTNALWEAAVRIGEFEIQPWDELFLDAAGLDVELGPSVVLAAAAVETRIAHALSTLATGKLPEELWTWIEDRHGGDPSVADQLDVLLRTLGGRSLKDDPRLWEAGVHLRQARNTFVHEGQATFGKARTPVTRQKARELVAQAGEIIEFIEALLPEEERRPRFEGLPDLTATLRFQGPEGDETDDGPDGSPS